MRNLRVEAGLSPQKRAPKMCLILQNEALRDGIEENRDLIQMITRVEVLELPAVGGAKPPKSLATVFDGGELVFPVGDLLDVEKKFFVCAMSWSSRRISKKASVNWRMQIFLSRAPEEIVEKESCCARRPFAAGRAGEANIKSLNQVD